MYRDLKDNAEKILENPNVCQLLGEPIELPEEEENEGTVGDPLIELHSVVDADSSQMEAIEMAKSGKSFVLQGLREQAKARRSRISSRNVSAMEKSIVCVGEAGRVERGIRQTEAGGSFGVLPGTA